MDWISGLPTAPVQAWDALVCTSNVVRSTVEFLLDAQTEFLKSRLGAAEFPRPQLPVMPLGVDTAAFAPDAGKRAAARALYGIGDADITVLFVGRLSFHAKAHPLPMYVGLEGVARANPGRCIHLDSGRLVRQYRADGERTWRIVTQTVSTTMIPTAA
jgi:hypothetical protein